jgi:hypothetical protein
MVRNAIVLWFAVIVEVELNTCAIELFGGKRVTVVSKCMPSRSSNKVPAALDYNSTSDGGFWKCWWFRCVTLDVNLLASEIIV